jgi:methylmalonyl-CoA/ethylmalonyl-CoA epimerase
VERATETTLTALGAVFDHACHAAPSIRSLLPVYADLLGGRFVQGGDNARVGYRAVQLAFADGTRIELMEPLTGSTFLDSFFARNPRGGLHHVTFKVRDIDAGMRRLEELGFSVTKPFLDDPGWQEVFVHPREAAGVLVQLAQAGPEDAWEGAESLEAVLAGRGPFGDGVASP